jgi:hypothetical protein
LPTPKIIKTTRKKSMECRGIEDGVIGDAERYPNLKMGGQALLVAINQPQAWRAGFHVSSRRQ